MAKKFEFGNVGDQENKDEVSIIDNYVASIKEKYGMIYPKNQVSNLYRTLFRSMATILKYFEAKTTPKIGCSLLNDNGEFCLGSILTYQEPEEGEEEDSGNWNLSFTLTQDDMKDLDKHIDSMSDSFVSVARAELYAAMFGHFKDTLDMSRMFDEAIKVIVNFLDRNSNDGEEVELTLPGIFTASCGFEDGVKLYSIVPGAMVKQIIKDDTGLANK